MAWYEKYIGKPWAKIPNCIDEYNCGELVRCVFKELFAIETLPIVADAGRYSSVVNAMQPERYDLIPVIGRDPRELDIVFFVQGTRQNHVGVAVNTTEGLMIMHCLDHIGVKLDSPFQILNMDGYRKLRWFEHKSRPKMEDALCLKS